MPLLGEGVCLLFVYILWLDVGVAVVVFGNVLAFPDIFYYRSFQLLLLHVDKTQILI